jgi:hypothetical protein
LEEREAKKVLEVRKLSSSRFSASRRADRTTLSLFLYHQTRRFGFSSR